MAKNNNLEDFLINTSSAIKTRKGYPNNINNVSDISDLVEDKTGYPLSENTGSMQYISDYVDTVIDHSMVFFSNSSYIALLYGFDSNNNIVDLYKADVKLTLHPTYGWLLENMSDTYYISYNIFVLSSGAWDGLYNGSNVNPREVINIQNDFSTVTTQPFDTKFIIPAQNFEQEILSIPGGSSSEYGDDVLPSEVTLTVTSGGNGSPPTEETRTLVVSISESFDNYNTMYVRWSGSGSGAPYGEGRSRIDVGSLQTTLFSFAGTGQGWPADKAEEVTAIDISTITGHPVVNLVVTAESYDQTPPYTHSWAASVIKVFDIYLKQ